MGAAMDNLAGSPPMSWALWGVLAFSGDGGEQTAGIVGVKKVWSGALTWAGLQ